MNILVLIEKATLGGHVLSALTTAKELKKRGHKVTVAAGPGSYVSEIRKAFKFYEIPFFYTYAGRQTYFTWKSLKTVKELYRKVSEEKFDLIHAFDSRSHIATALLDLFFYPIPFTSTSCGGLAPYYNLPVIGKMIVFSPEQKKKMVEKYGWNSDQVVVIRSRLDMEQFEISDAEVESLCKDYGIDPQGNNIMMITTFLGPKVRPIKNVLAAMELILKKHTDYNFVIIGGKGDFFKEAKKIGRKINDRLGRKAISFTGPVVGAFRLLKVARIVIGQGRSAFEGMAFSKPTLIVGNMGYAGIVSEETIKQISFYNFSGRNNKKFVNEHVLVEAIERLLSDKAFYDRTAKFGRKFVEKHIAISAGISKIENVYLENIEFHKQNSRINRKLNLFKIMLPIMIDNYYNQIKSIIRASVCQVM